MRRRARERRRQPRRRIVLPVHFEDGRIGTSRDISAAGIFVHIDRRFACGESIRLAVGLGRWDPEGGFRIRGEGRVVRVETLGVAFDVVWADIEALGPAVGPEAPAPG